MEKNCELCSEPIRFRVLQPCNHSNICLECYIRFSAVYHHSTCYFCQRNLDHAPVVVAADDTRTHAAAMAAHPRYDGLQRLYYFDAAVEEHISALFRFRCPACSMRFSAFDVFAEHAKCHRLCPCAVCFHAGRFLPSEVPALSAREHEQHARQHPACACCERVYFDQALLAVHMLEEHNRCEICAQQNRIHWCRDPVELIAHNEKCHFICHHTACSSENLIAFATKGELLMHLQSVHHEKFVEIDFTTDFKVDTEDTYEAKSRMRLVELNRRFTQKLNKVFAGREEKINRLKGIAKQYVSNVIDSEEFYRQFAGICGNKKGQIFTDMVAILPNPKKRAELLYIHEHAGAAEEEQTPKVNRRGGARNGPRTQNGENSGEDSKRNEPKAKTPKTQNGGKRNAPNIPNGGEESRRNATKTPNGGNGAEGNKRNAQKAPNGGNAGANEQQRKEKAPPPRAKGKKKKPQSKIILSF